MGTYKASDGKRYTQSQIDAKITKAKKLVLEAQQNELGYNVCTECMRNDCLPIDCAHLISVDKAKKEGRTEECWNPWNIIPLGRSCHQKLDGLNLQFNDFKEIGK